MAKLKHGIFGPLSGKLGPLVGATWMGIPYVREKAKKKENPDPPSPAQIANQEKLKFVNILLMPFHPYVTVGFQNLAIQKTAISAAFSVNFHRAITGVYPNLGVDYSKMMISKGDLPGLVNPQITLVEDNKLKIEWEDNHHFSVAYDDQLIVVIYSPDLHLADGFIGGVKRADMTVTFTFNELLIGQLLEAYIGLISLNRKKIADSVYMGRITP